MRDEYFINPEGRPKELDGVIQEMNDILQRIGRRQDSAEGWSGNAVFRNHLDANGNRVTNISDPRQPKDAISLTYADRTYVKQGGSQITNVVNGVTSGFVIDAGSASVTGSGTITTRLATVNYAVASLGEDASIAAYPGVTVTPSGASLTLKVWKPTSALDPTPIAATVAKTVYWWAIGT